MEPRLLVGVIAGSSAMSSGSGGVLALALGGMLGVLELPPLRAVSRPALSLVNEPPGNEDCQEGRVLDGNAGRPLLDSASS